MSEESAAQRRRRNRIGPEIPRNSRKCQGGRRSANKLPSCPVPAHGPPLYSQVLLQWINVYDSSSHRNGTSGGCACVRGQFREKRAAEDRAKTSKGLATVQTSRHGVNPLGRRLKNEDHCFGLLHQPGDRRIGNPSGTALKTVHWPRPFTVLIAFLLSVPCVALADQNYSAAGLL